MFLNFLSIDTFNFMISNFFFDIISSITLPTSISDVFFSINLNYCYTLTLDHDLVFNNNFLNLPLPASERMNSLVILYLEVSYITLFIFFIVSLVLLETILVHSSSEWNTLFQSYSKSDETHSFNVYPVHFTTEEEHFIDIFVICIPTLIILQIIVPTLGYLYNEEMLYYDTYVSFDVNVIGNQWYWTYEYVIDFCSIEHFSEWSSQEFNDKEPIFIKFDSVIKLDNSINRLLDVDNPLILPVNTNILFSFTSRDVIHSWALPQMGIKVDCIPGRITHTIFSSFALGVFYGQCSELCGPLHGFMPICVEVISFEEFVIWILIKYKYFLHDLGVYTDLILTKEVFSLIGFNENEKISSFIAKYKI